MSKPTFALGDVCDINPSTDFQFEADDACTFVPMEAVDEGDARIARAITKPFRQVSKGYTPFAENDVIVAKITPCMENGKCAIGRNLRSGVAFGSTEFHVLRGTRHVIPEWLYYFWRFPPTRTLASLNMTGSAGQKRVPTSFLETARIPLPDIPEQRRLVARLDQADRLRRTRRYALEVTDTFLPAAFLELFGDPISNPKGWEKKPLGQICTIRRGASPRPIERFLGGSVPWIKIGDGTKGDRIYITSTEDHVTDAGAAKSVFLKRGTLVFANSGSCGFARLLKIDGCIHDGWLAFQGFEQALDPIFFLQAINQITPHLRRLAPEGTQPNLNTGIMSDFAMVVPPLQTQQEFAALVARVERLLAVQQEALRQAEHLFATLLHRAFVG